MNKTSGDNQNGGGLAKMHEDLKLYVCTLFLDTETYGHENMFFQLRYYGKSGSNDQQLPYDTLIVDYNSLSEDMKIYPVGAINERFFWHEVEAMAKIFSRLSNLTFEFFEEKLPINNNIMANSWLPLGGGVGMCLLPEDDVTPLDFEVNCCYDTRFCNCAYCNGTKSRDFFDSKGIHFGTREKYDYDGFDCAGYNCNGLHKEEIPATNIGLVGRKFATIFGKAECG